MLGSKINIGVIGGHVCTKAIAKIAEEVGELIAKEGWVLICGGRGGVMEAACRGAQRLSGICIGILPSPDGKDANAYLTVGIPTGLGYARNFLIVRACHVLIAIAGECGTLSELSFALSEGKKVIGIETWDIPGVQKVDSASSAIKASKRILSTLDI